MLGPNRGPCQRLVTKRDRPPSVMLKQEPFTRRMLGSEGTAPLSVREQGQILKQALLSQALYCVSTAEQGGSHRQ